MDDVSSFDFTDLQLASTRCIVDIHFSEKMKLLVQSKHPAEPEKLQNSSAELRDALWGCSSLVGHQLGNTTGEFCSPATQPLGGQFGWWSSCSSSRHVTDVCMSPSGVSRGYQGLRLHQMLSSGSLLYPSCKQAGKVKLEPRVFTDELLLKAF